MGIDATLSVSEPSFASEGFWSLASSRLVGFLFIPESGVPVVLRGPESSG